MPSPTPPPHALDFALEIARAGGRIALENFRRPHDIKKKGRGDLVTETDLRVERLVQEAIARQFPGHGVLSEETAPRAPLEGWVWVIDPIDGTRNFVSGIPFFCINVALCHDGKPQIAVTHDPNHNDTFSAQRGAGARLNGEPMRASTVASVRDAVVGFDLGYDDRRGQAMLHLISKLFPGVQSLRIPGSAALGLAYAASGRYDIFLHHFLFPWDIAAGILLMEESGGGITDHLGGPTTIRSQTVVGGSPGAHAGFLRWQQEHLGELDLPAET